MKKVLISLYLEVTEPLDFVHKKAQSFYCKAEVFKVLTK